MAPDPHAVFVVKLCTVLAAAMVKVYGGVNDVPLPAVFPLVAVKILFRAVTAVKSLL